MEDLEHGDSDTDDTDYDCNTRWTAVSLFVVLISRV
jgi:hypothetical protein